MDRIWKEKSQVRWLGGLFSGGGQGKKIVAILHGSMQYLLIQENKHKILDTITWKLPSSKKLFSIPCQYFALSPIIYYNRRVCIMRTMIIEKPELMK